MGSTLHMYLIGVGFVTCYCEKKRPCFKYRIKQEISSEIIIIMVKIIIIIIIIIIITLFL